MTREEILNMPAGREMDALIAKFVMKVDSPHDVCKFSTDIADAWTVVEKMKSKHFRIYYKSVPFHKDDKEPIGWMCSVSGFEFMPEHADTAPLAICRAALLAVMEAE